MQIKSLLPLAAAPAVLGQTLPELLAAQNSTLSTLVGLLQSQPALLNTVAGLKNITILAPSNAAFEKLLADPAVAAKAGEPGFVAALLSYHVINGAYYASNFLAATDAPVFVPTYLTNETFSTVEGGQVVEAQTMDGSVVVTSGNGAESKVVGADFNFTDGVVHVIDSVLSIPGDLTVALTDEDLSSLAAAVTTAKLGPTLVELDQVTLFAPNNAAFAKIRDVAANLTVEQLTQVLTYHAVAGQVVYSTDIVNGATVKTVQGGDLTFVIRDGGAFVNDARVVEPNVLVKNGVVHVIDAVLIPKADGSSTGGSGSGSGGGMNPAPVPGMAPGNKAALGTALFGTIVALFTLL